MSNQNPPFNSNIPAILQEEEYDLNDDNLELHPDLEGVNTTQESEGHTTIADETREEDRDWSFGPQENPGAMTMEELQGGAGKKKKKTATKKKATKKKTAKKKTTKKKTATKKKTTKKKTAKKKTATKKKTTKKKTAKKKKATKKKTAKKKKAAKKSTAKKEEKKKGILGLFMGGKDKKKTDPEQFIAPMQRLL